MIERVNKTTTILGATGTGKTTFLLQVINKMLQAGVHDKVIIFDVDDHDAYKQYPIIEPKYLPTLTKGVVRCFIDDDNLDDVMGIVSNSVRNTIIVYEDAGRYLMSGMDVNTKRIFVDKKKKNYDVFIMYHGCSEPPPKVYILSDYIALFKTNDTPQSNKGKIPNYPVFQQAFLEVQANPNQYFHKLFSLR